MAYKVYNISLKSKELRGATQPNIIRLAFNSDADALTFKTNLEQLFAAKVVSVDVALSSDHTLPYPAGTNRQARCAMWDDAGQTNQLRILDLVDGFEPKAFSDNLIAAGILIKAGGTFHAPTRINAYDMEPGPSF